MASARPNAAHRALSELEQLGHIELLVTQNVDRLHQRAGSRSVIDLHGRLDRVVCLQCWHHSCRHELQDKLEASNGTPEPGTLRPDGDAEAEPASDDFCVPTCGHCGGTLMPDVVFFGGTVPRERVEQAMAALHRADALLAIGTSLQVFSGFRFCREAKKMGKAIALVNPGQTRADTMADIHIREDCGAVLAELVTSLQRPSAALHSHSPTHRPQPDR